MNGNKETVGELYEAFQQCVQLFKVKDYDGAETILTSTTELGKRVLKQNIRSNNCQEIYEIRAILSRLYVYKARLCCTNGLFLQALSEFEEALNVSCFLDGAIVAEVFTNFMPTFNRWMLDTVKINEKELEAVFRKQKINRTSTDTMRSLYGLLVAINTAEALRKNGTRGYDNDFLKNLHIERASLLLQHEFAEMNTLALIDCEKAIEYANGRDFEALRVAALVFNQFGDSHKAYECCQDALKLKKTRELELLLMEIKADIGDEMTIVLPEVKAVESQKPDDQWISGTNVTRQKKQNEKAATANAQQQKKRKTSRSRNRRRGSLSSCGAGESRGRDSSVESTASECVEISTEKTGPSSRRKSADNSVQVYQRNGSALPKDRGDIVRKDGAGATSPSKPAEVSRASTSQPVRASTPPARSQAMSSPRRAHEGNRFNGSFNGPTPASPKRKKAKVASKRIFDKVLHAYELKLACEECFDASSDHQNGRYIPMNHDCGKSRLLLRHRVENTPWVLVRNNPVNHNGVVEACDEQLKGNCEKGLKCKFAHSEVERCMWKLCLDSKWNIEAFMKDLKSTSLLLRAVLSSLPENVEIFLGCKKCVKNKKYTSCKKQNSHTPVCEENHQWNKVTADAMVRIVENAEDVDDFLHPLVSEMPLPEDSPTKLHEMLNEAWALLQGDFKPCELVEELDIVRKQMKDVPLKLKNNLLERVRIPQRTNQRNDSISGNSGGGQDFDDDENTVFDTEFDDILTNKDVDEGEDTVFGDYDESDVYYINKPKEELERLLVEESDQYKRCRISLIGTMKAKCYILDRSESQSDDDQNDGSPDNNKGMDEIEIRGRQNCGQSFDGDEVVVEIMDVLKLDQYVLEGQTVKRGRVVGIWKECSNREAYRYVCTVDSYFSHLMKPICGIAPKIHCEHREIKDLNDKVKNRLVCVYEKNGTKIEYVRRVQINPKEKHAQIFVVKYDKWTADKMYPYGYVAKVIEPGKTIVSGQRLIDLMYQVPAGYDQRLMQYAEARFGTSIPKSFSDKRKSLVQVNIISIDPPGCRDVDDALSLGTIEKDGKQYFELGVHIADVSAFVQKDDDIDEEVMKRRITFYPADKENGKTHHMLPEILSTDMCSLVENKERLALSVSIKLNEDGTMNGKPKFMKSLVKNKRQLTYAEAQNMIEDPNEDEDGTVEMVQTLHRLAQARRRIRLGDGVHHREIPCITEEDDNATEAHALVEEFMILANTCAAEFLIEKYETDVPLRMQRQPRQEKKENWMKNYSNTALGSFFFDRFIETDGIELDPSKSYHILPTTQRNLSKGLQGKSKEQILSAVTNENIHPSFVTAHESWIGLQHPAEVVVFDHKEQGKHFSLQKELYTWFTSPIRRSIDIVVHRMIKAALEGGRMCQRPYTKSELQSLCTKFNTTHRRQKKHDHACEQLKTAQFLQESPLYLASVVTAFDDSDLEFQWPFLHNIKKSIRTLRLSLFGVCDKPRYFGNDVLTVFWQKRMYDAGAKKPKHARTKQDARYKNYFAIDHNLHTTCVSSSLWIDLVQAVAEEQRQENIFALTRRLLRDKDLYGPMRGCVRQQEYSDVHVRLNPEHEGSPARYFSDLTSEMQGFLKIVKHHVKFSTSFYEGLVCQLQLGCIYQKGLIEPQINMLSLTPTLDLCIEHSRDPVACFAEVAVRSHKRDYNSIHDYKETWLPMLAMEAACNAVHEGDPIIISNVPVDLKKTSQTFTGVFELTLDFCKHRQINLFANNKDKNESQMDENDDAQDYLCLRVPTESSALVLPHNNVNAKEHITKRNKWSCHCIINPKKSFLTKEKTVKVHFDVHQWSSEPPKTILDPIGSSKISGTIEFLAKPLPDRRMEMAVNKLADATDFCQKIVLGETFREEDAMHISPEDVPSDLNIFVKYESPPEDDFRRFIPPEKARLPENNPSQDEAIRVALTQKFTLIQGPPGTGKTLTGTKLVYWFNEMNKKGSIGKKKHVMYCGPSNSAVDVAAKTLQARLREKCPKIVRVYSEMLENQVYPLPRDAMVMNAKSRRYEMGGNPSLDAISLHHLIRKKENKFHRKILEFDRKFKITPPEKIDDEEVEAYQKLITDAAVHELAQHEVVLCTCSVSASPRILRGTNVTQCIIDECGMCMEPETLVPLVSHKPAQVVLIGDHKQLRPIVSNPIAKELGLEISMFERQANLCKNKYGKSFKVIMLREQYRMHREICRFPSKHFYEDRLVTIPTRYWTGVPFTIWPKEYSPIAFCHVEGEEKSQSVSTEEGNEQSKSNKAEIDNAVRIYLQFVNEYGVRQNSIVILSQYKAQCKLIEKELVEYGIEKPRVSTVVASQGDEWDYVILSTVRSLPRYEIEKRPSQGWLKKNLGFIIDHHQINVAITRARRGLIIIGNKHLLKCDHGDNGLWAHLLNFYESRDAVINIDKFPVREEELEMRQQLHKEGQEYYWSNQFMMKRKDREENKAKEGLAPRFQRNLKRDY